MRKQVADRSLSNVKKYFPNVTKVMNAKGKIRVQVTQGDVNTSQRKAHAGCAMAVACKRAMKLDGVIISTSRAYLIKGTKAIKFDTPEAVSREIVSFDRGARFEPGEYELWKPQKPREGGGSHNDHRGVGKGKPRQVHHLTKNVRAALGSENER